MEQVRRQSRNVKTSMRQQRPGGKYQQSKVVHDVCKSISIFPIKIHNSSSVNDKQKPTNESFKNIKIHTTSNLIYDKQNKRRRTLLSIKSKPCLKTQDIDEFRKLFQGRDQLMTEPRIPQKNERRSSISFANTGFLTSVNEQQSEKLFQMLHQKKDLMMLDHSRLAMQTKKFKLLLNQFQFQIKQIKTERDSLSQKVSKYQHYFKQMKLKYIPTDQQEQSMQKNQQLKILNLQKKVQTLNYIIKQYRTNNNQQVRNFQLKLKDFKPSIQKQLTEKLAQTNQKYQGLLRKVQFFQKQCSLNLKVDWEQLMTQFEQTRAENQKNINIVKQLIQTVSQLNQAIAQNRVRMQDMQKLEDQILQHKLKLQKLTDLKLDLEEAIVQKDQKIDQLNHLYEQTSFKLEGLKNLQFRIQNKDKTIKINTIVINKLQCQNIELKSKIDTVLGQFQSRVFCQKNLQQDLLKANTAIHELTSRLQETFLDFHKNPNSSLESAKQKEHFIGHLFEKVKASYNHIISQYQNQLKMTNTQCGKWRQTFTLISKNQEHKLKYAQKTQHQLQEIQNKKNRCQQIFNKISNQALDQGKVTGKQCLNCKHLIAYWGQLQNSYTQLRNILGKVMKMQSVYITDQIKQDNLNTNNVQMKELSVYDI